MGSTERSTFYDEHPFDWAPLGPDESLRSVVSPALADLIDGLEKDLLVLDIGCGSGRVLGWLAKRGVRCIGLDQSRVSVNLATDRYARPGVVGDNLQLPFKNGVADVIISDGVIHHTGDPSSAFRENCRVLKPGGRMYLAVYRPTGHYPWLYKYPGGAIRSGLRRRWTKPFVTLFARAPYFVIHFVRSKGRRTWAGARNLFYDYFVTPQIAFVPREIVDEWCAGNGVCVVSYDENRHANVHSFCIVKIPHRQYKDELVGAEVLAGDHRGAR